MEKQKNSIETWFSIKNIKESIQHIQKQHFISEFWDEFWEDIYQEWQDWLWKVQHVEATPQDIIMRFAKWESLQLSDELISAFELVCYLAEEPESRKEIEHENHNSIRVKIHDLKKRYITHFLKYIEENGIEITFWSPKNVVEYFNKYMKKYIYLEHGSIEGFSNLLMHENNEIISNHIYETLLETKLWNKNPRLQEKYLESILLVIWYLLNSKLENEKPEDLVCLFEEKINLILKD